MDKLFTLLQINDSMFPIGSFTHSYGLEAYVDQGIVHDNESAERYAGTMLMHNIYYNDAAFVYKAWHLADSKSHWKKTKELDELVTCLKLPSEVSRASQKLGLRFLKLTTQLEPWQPGTRYLTAIERGELFGHYPVAFGLYTRASGIPLKNALTAFYYSAINAIATNCAKMVPISQTVGQKILFNLQNTVNELVETQGSIPEKMIGLGNPGHDIKCMQHEKQYTRIYIS